MTWYRWRAWRLAWTWSDNRDGSVVWDGRGRWAHVAGPLWWLQAPGAGVLS